MEESWNSHTDRNLSNVIHAALDKCRTMKDTGTGVSSHAKLSTHDYC